MLIPGGDVYNPVKAVLKRYGLLVKESLKKSDFAGPTEAVRILNRLLRFGKGQQENAAALPEADLHCSMAALSALVKYLNVRHINRNSRHLPLILLPFQLMGDESNFGQYALSTFDFRQYVRLDAAAASALHLTSYGWGAESTVKGPPRTIAALLNKCRTSGGQRLLAQWIKQPLTDKNRIERRLDVVEAFVGDVHLRQSVTEDHLRRMPDFQRLAKKMQKSRASLLDLYK